MIKTNYLQESVEASAELDEASVETIHAEHNNWWQAVLGEVIRLKLVMRYWKNSGMALTTSWLVVVEISVSSRFIWQLDNNRST